MCRILLLWISLPFYNVLMFVGMQFKYDFVNPPCGIVPHIGCCSWTGFISSHWQCSWMLVYYTVSQKMCDVEFWQWLCQILTNFQNSFSARKNLMCRPRQGLDAMESMERERRSEGRVSSESPGAKHREADFVQRRPQIFVIVDNFSVDEMQVTKNRPVIQRLRSVALHPRSVSYWHLFKISFSAWEYKLRMYVPLANCWESSLSFSRTVLSHRARDTERLHFTR